MPLPDGQLVESPEFNNTVTSWSYQFDQVGVYYPYIVASNLVMTTDKIPLESCCPVVVQHPVLAESYRLTASPTVGKLVFESAEDEIGSAITEFILWKNILLTEPSEPYYTVYVCLYFFI